MSSEEIQMAERFMQRYAPALEAMTAACVDMASRRDMDALRLFVSAFSQVIACAARSVKMADLAN